MQKLVSKNPIQRFKQGKKILKAQKGILTDNVFLVSPYNVEDRRRVADYYGGVRSLQQKLVDLGFLTPNQKYLRKNKNYNGVDGMWGEDTENAYQKYIRSNNFVTTVGNNYQNKLSEGITVTENKPKLASIVQTSTISDNGISNFIPQSTTKTFNKSEIRDYIRSKGKGAYDYTGAQRRALRMVMNGQGTDEDKTVVKAMGLFKVGGQLVSRNPIKRFKNKKK